ncbi:MAG: ATP-binding cassette domain-containing protein [Clostridia bacterium]|nr:ATP-binding cassette domain-containing protein [Clostridia bacterium]
MTDIVIKNLSKRYGELLVLDGFSAHFAGGKTTCVMGRSGCGKTTLLRLLLGLERADGGKITGVPARCSAVFQEDRLCPEFSAIENVRIAAPRRTGEEIRATLSALLLDGEAQEKPVSELSGGMRRRVAIARALLAEGELLLMDEPFKGLDEATRDAVLAYVKRATAGRTVILVTHDEAEAKALAAPILYLGEL